METKSEIVKKAALKAGIPVVEHPWPSAEQMAVEAEDRRIPLAKHAAKAYDVIERALRHLEAGDDSRALQILGTEGEEIVREVIDLDESEAAEFAKMENLELCAYWNILQTPTLRDPEGAIKRDRHEILVAREIENRGGRPEYGKRMLYKGETGEVEPDRGPRKLVGVDRNGFPEDPEANIPDDFWPEGR